MFKKFFKRDFGNFGFDDDDDDFFNSGVKFRDFGKPVSQPRGSVSKSIQKTTQIM